VILDRVVRPAGQELGDLRPTVAQLRVCLDQQSLLFLRPDTLLDQWSEVVVPTLPALLADSSLCCVAMQVWTRWLETQQA
jgi:hypothetical protein